MRINRSIHLTKTFTIYPSTMSRNDENFLLLSFTQRAVDQPCSLQIGKWREYANDRFRFNFACNKCVFLSKRIHSRTGFKQIETFHTTHYNKRTLRLLWSKVLYSHFGMRNKWMIRVINFFTFTNIEWNKNNNKNNGGKFNWNFQFLDIPDQKVFIFILVSWWWFWNSIYLQQHVRSI